MVDEVLLPSTLSGGAVSSFSESLPPELSNDTSVSMSHAPPSTDRDLGPEVASVFLLLVALSLSVSSSKSSSSHSFISSRSLQKKG